MQKKHICYAIALMLVATTFTGCDKINSIIHKDQAEAAPAAEEPAVQEVHKAPVQTAKASSGHIASYRSFGGDVVPHDTKSIIPTTSGEVKSLLIVEGDVVTKGQVVATIDQTKAGMNYKPTQIKAPMDGTVSSVTTQVGAQAGIGQPIGTVISTGDLEIKFDVAERLLYAAKLGGKVEVSFDAYPGETFPATITKMAATLNTATRTREITIKLDQPDERIISGMYAKVNVLLSEADDAVIVPSDAVSGDHVYIVKDGVAHKSIVKTGIASGDQIQILEGVQAGDEVVIAGFNQLSDGTEVNVIASKEEQ